jgi:redox-sensitive bicupin YhaK (pirin superfamily)
VAEPAATPEHLGLRPRTVDRVVGPFPKGAHDQVDANVLLINPDERRTSDPFLFLSEDWFSTVGFDWHPHRGFETVTMVLDGELEHHDNAGGHGVLGPGDVQWVTTGRGVIHSELAHRRRPVHTLQLWLNLPAALKMVPPRYQDLRAADAPVIHDPGAVARVFSGTVRGVRGHAENYWPTTVVDVHFERGGTFVHEVPGEHTLFLYVHTGAVRLGPRDQRLEAGQAAWFFAGEPGASGITITADDQSLIVAFSAAPIREPVVAYGPFVMNTPEEINAAIRDYQRGDFGPIPPRNVAPESRP